MLLENTDQCTHVIFINFICDRRYPVRTVLTVANSYRKIC